MSLSEGRAPESVALVDIAIDSWRFARLFARLIAKLDAGEQARYESQLRWYLKRLEEQLDATGLKIVNIEGQAFDAGVAATPLNAGDFSAEDVLYVDQMLEPIIMGPAGLVRAGTVLLRKLER